MESIKVTAIFDNFNFYMHIFVLRDFCATLEIEYFGRRALDKYK